jgi:hypothetical protein
MLKYHAVIYLQLNVQELTSLSTGYNKNFPGGKIFPFYKDRTHH